MEKSRLVVSEVDQRKAYGNCCCWGRQVQSFPDRWAAFLPPAPSYAVQTLQDLTLDLPVPCSQTQSFCPLNQLLNRNEQGKGEMLLIGERLPKGAQHHKLWGSWRSILGVLWRTKMPLGRAFMGHQKWFVLFKLAEDGSQSWSSASLLSDHCVTLCGPRASTKQATFNTWASASEWSFFFFSFSKC